MEKGKRRWPEFGFRWNHLSATEANAVIELTGAGGQGNIDHFYFFRINTDQIKVYLLEDGTYKGFAVAETNIKKFLALIPKPFRLKPNIALPDSVPICMLASDPCGNGTAYARGKRISLYESVLSNLVTLGNKDSIVTNAVQLAGVFGSYPSGDESGLSEDELKLAKDLVFEIAGIDEGAIDDLFDSLKEGQDAYANSIIQEINGRMASTLNFPNWWVQDTDFRMQVTARDFDLTFTVVDRTGREYSFKERSSGLKYFLSYYIQYRAHRYSNDIGEILLMDEPDQFLSSRGQQDLLKIFESFVVRKNARNENEKSQKTQLVYVTHSPFLIDKNHAQRIRVLEKGVGDEGTRIVKNVARNHYEPLRSAFGSFVGETTFIGNCNLMTEGPGDQIIIAGASMMLGRETGISELDTLDLNKITIVPAGGASHVPYMVYLAKGRDVERPAVIVMLDSDKAGNDAKKAILKSGPNNKQLLDSKFILQTGELPIEGDIGIKTATGNAAIEIEDFVPIRICFLAAGKYLNVMCHASEAEAEAFKLADVTAQLSNGESIVESIEKTFKNINVEFRLDKVGFARLVVETVEEIQSQVRPDDDDKSALADYINNMKVLFRRLGAMQRSAVRELSSKNISRRFERIRKSFVDDNKNAPKKEKALLVCEEIDAFLDDSVEADTIRMGLKSMRRVHELDFNSHEVVSDFEKLKEDLNALKYAPIIEAQQKDVISRPSDVVAETSSTTKSKSASKEQPVTAADAGNVKKS